MPALGDLQGVRLDPVDEPVFQIEAPGRPARQLVPQRLGFAPSGEWRAQAFLQEPVDSLAHLAVHLLPVETASPAAWLKTLLIPAEHARRPPPLRDLRLRRAAAEQWR